MSLGSVYYLPKPVSERDLTLMRRIDELHLEYPFAGSRMLRVTVLKTGSPTEVPETGGNVTFTYRVTNNSAEAAEITALSDDKFGTLAGDADCKVGTILAGGAYCEFSATFAIPAGDYPGTHVNSFTATSEDNDGNSDSGSDSETVTYTDVLPDISVPKTANPAPVSVPETGGSVTFDFVVTNNSTEAATITALSDDPFGTLAGDADCHVGTVLAGGASCSFSATFAIPAGDYPGSHVNIFTANAVYNSTPLSASDPSLQPEAVGAARGGNEFR